MLVPFLRGENIKRWRVEPEGLFLINTPKGKVRIDDYPAIRDWLLPFKPELEKRATKQEWFELQQAQLAYQPQFLTEKIVYLDIAGSSPFALDAERRFIDCTVFMVPTSDYAVLAFLNSSLAWFQWVGQTPIASGGYIRLKTQYLTQTVLPRFRKSEHTELSKKGLAAAQAGNKRFEILSAVRRRLFDFPAAGATRKLSRKLENWWELDFASFRTEVKRVFRTDIPVKERAEWEAYLSENAAEVRKLTASIEETEREIDAIVYKLFDFTADEVKLLEESLDGQY